MEYKSRLLNVIYQAMDEVNETLPADKKLVKAPGTVLFDPFGPVDSLSLTILIVAIEQKVESEFGVYVGLIDANTTAPENNPFLNIASLVQHLEGLLKAKSQP